MSVLNSTSDTVSEQREKDTKKLSESLKKLEETTKNIIQERQARNKAQPKNQNIDIEDPRASRNASGKIDATISNNGDVKDTMYYVDRYTDGYEQFMKFINHEFAVTNGIFNKLPDKYENECVKADQELAVTQKFVPLYLDPNSPYKGLLLNHHVGAGKTRIGFHTLSKYYHSSKKSSETSSPRLIWVTSRDLVKDIQERFEEFKWFWNENENPFTTGENQWRGDKPIYLFSFKEFTNALKGKNSFGQRFLWRKEPSKAYKIDPNTGDWEDNALFDPLENTFIVIDEVHTFYDSPYSVNRLLEKSIFDSYKKSKQNGIPSVKLLLLTGTPIPPITLKHTGPPVAQSSIPLHDVPFTVFRMLNLLIDDETKRLPSTRAQFLSVYGRDPADMDEQSIERFKNSAKGLVSYFNPTFQYNLFAKRITRAEIIATASESVVKQIEEHCMNPASQERDVYGRSPEKGRCLWWVSNWAGTGDYNWPPKSWKIGWRVDMNDFDYQDVLTKLPDLSPKTLKLIENIKYLDNQDREKFGKTYKHYIFSNLPPSKGSTIVNAALQANGFKYVRAPKRLRDLGLSAVTSQRDMNELGLNQPTIVGNLRDDQQQSSNNFFFLEHNLHSNEKFTTKLAFSNHRLNNYGQIARIIVVDKEHKEGINLMDVKYIHILEPQLTGTDEQQIIGRALRKCGHQGLPFEEWNYSVFIYDIEVPKYAFKRNDFGNELLSEEVMKEIIDPLILQDKKVITQMIQDIAVDKYINNPNNADRIEQEISEKILKPESNIFKPYTSKQLDSISLHNSSLKKLSKKELQSSIDTEESNVINEEQEDNNINNISDSLIEHSHSRSHSQKGWSLSITPENSKTFEEKLRNNFLIPFFEFTPRTKFEKRYIEMFTEPFETSMEKVKYIEDDIKGLNYDKNIVFYFPRSGVLYIPVFNTDVQHVKSNSRYLKLLQFNLKCIFVFSTRGRDSFAILLRDSSGVVKEIGPVKSNKKYIQSAIDKLNTTNLELIAE